MIGVRILIVLGGLLTVLAGWWGRTHADATPRYSAGVGSGLSGGSRRFFGGVVFVIGLFVVLSGLLGVPRELMQ